MFQYFLCFSFLYVVFMCHLSLCVSGIYASEFLCFGIYYVSSSLCVSCVYVPVVSSPFHLLKFFNYILSIDRNVRKLENCYYSLITILQPLHSKFVTRSQVAVCLPLAHSHLRVSQKKSTSRLVAHTLLGTAVAALYSSLCTLHHSLYTCTYVPGKRLTSLEVWRGNGL